MKVIEYIKLNGLESLNKEFGIIVKKYDEGLIVLNYNQIESPKNEITNECRGLIIDKEFNVVSRSFDRFFNYGENFATFNPNTAVAYEKVDGSLIKIYNWQGNWHVSTRGTAFAESGVNGWDITFKDMVFKALEVGSEEEFQDKCEDWLDCSRTYIFEVTGVENRVVTRYKGYTLWFLASRNNLSGRYYSHESTNIMGAFGAKELRTFKFNSIESCLETAKHLPDLQEGYVMYEGGVPICKVKSPAYVAVHHIRSNISSPSNYAKLVLLGEKEEYLSYFPEESDKLNGHEKAWNNIKQEILDNYSKYCDIKEQKEFAIQVKDLKNSWVYFEAKKKQLSIDSVLNNTDIDRKIKMVLEYQ